MEEDSADEDSDDKPDPVDDAEYILQAGCVDTIQTVFKIF